MKVLVTGGTGFVGRAVLRQLHANGHAIRLLVRRPDSESARATISAYDAELCGGDILDEGSLAPACAGMDAVVHLVGIITEYGTQTFENVHAKGTRNLISAAQSEDVRRLVHMSALGTRPGAASAYHQTKWLGEQSVRRADMAWTILRPSIIYGPGDGFVSLFERISRYSPVVPLAGGGRTRLQPVRVEDVAACFERALTERQAVGQTYDLCGPAPLTLREIVQTILRVTGRHRLLLPLPMGVMRLQAALFESFYAPLFRRPPPLSQDQLLMLQEDNVGEPGAAMEQLDLKPITFEAGLSAYLGRRHAARPG
jgi:NADH dehydrogenase